jgi:hypothetical protein
MFLTANFGEKEINLSAKVLPFLGLFHHLVALVWSP